MSETDTKASIYLGKRVEGSSTYKPEFLVAVLREENRKLYEINSSSLPFEGWDVWHAYEFSALTKNGLPVTRTLKIKYNSTSPYIVESKSLKLYLNSFNMSKFGKNINECLTICKDIIQKDLSEKLKTEVEVNFLDNNTEKTYIFKDFINITENINENNLKINIFKEAPDLLQVEQTDSKTSYKLTFDSLRSNCRVTHQPDFGDVFIYYNSKKHITEESLLKYLCSFRCEYHFHEECCEMIYKRLSDILDNEDELFVCALYTRRGGIDINPCRWSKNCTIKDFQTLIDLSKLARYGIKQ